MPSPGHYAVIFAPCGVACGRYLIDAGQVASPLPASRSLNTMSHENGPLLASGEDAPDAYPPRKRVVSTVAILAILLGGIIFVAVRGERHAPKDPLGRANYYMERSVPRAEGSS